MSFIKNRQLFLDVLFVLGLLVFGFFQAKNYLEHDTKQPFFYQSKFAPAVNFACGYGLSEDKLGPTFALKNFLEIKSPIFHCEDLRPKPQLEYQVESKAWYYMMLSTGLLWKITGISWSAVDLLVALLFAGALGSVYGLYRLGMNPGLALIGSLYFAFLKYNLGYLFDLRDYSKAPFILFTLFLLGFIGVQSRSRFFLILISLLYGIVVGIGYGFRPDLLIMLPPMVVVLLFFLPKPEKSSTPNLLCLSFIKACSRTCFKNFFKTFGFKLILIFILLSSFALTISPILRNGADPKIGSCHWHFALLGLSAPYSEALHLSYPHYEWSHLNSDALINIQVNAYGERVMKMADVPYCSHRYDEVSKKLFFNIVKIFPADLITRSYKAIEEILSTKTVLLIGDHHIHLQLYALYTTPILLWVIAVYNLRIALFLFLGLIYFMGYPALQFDKRHYFHLLFWLYWPIGFFTDEGFKLFKHQWQQREFNSHYWHEFIHALLPSPQRLYQTGRLTIVALSPFILIYGLAYWSQQQAYNHLQNAYRHALRIPIAMTEERTNKQLTARFAIPMRTTATATDRFSEIKERLLVVLFNNKSCFDTMHLNLSYHSIDPAHEFSKNYPCIIKNDHRATEFFIPLYYVSGYAYPTQLKIYPIQQDCQVTIQQIKPDPHLPIWISGTFERAHFFPQKN